MASRRRSSKISKFCKLSVIRKKRCKVSITTLHIGIDENNGGCLQENLEGSVPFLDDNLVISSMVLAPLEGSVIDHSLVTSNLSQDWHLHQIQGNSDMALPIQQTIAKNFQSPPKYQSMSYLIPITSTNFKCSTSLIMSCNSSFKFL